MTTYREQVALSVRAVRILGPASFTWFGAGGSGLAPPPDFAVPSDLRDLLLTSLQDRLYHDFYLTGGARPAGGRPEAPPVHGDTPFVEALSNANKGSGYREDRWEVVDQDTDGILITRDGLQLVVARNEIASQAPTLPGDGVAILRAKESLALSPGFYMAHGNADLQFDGAVLRVYWNLTPLGAIQAMSRLTSGLNRTAVPFRLKVVNDPSVFGRGDALVLYLRASDFPNTVEILIHAAMDLRSFANRDVPALTKPFAHGVAIAEDPGPGLSFGAERCRVLAEAILKASDAGLPDLPARMRVVEAHFEAAGLSLDTPYLNPGSTDRYHVSAPQSGLSQPTRRPSPPDDVQAVAGQIAVELCQRAIWHDGRCTWLGEPPGTSLAQHIHALGPDLYAGSAGIGLFLAEIAAATGNADAKRTAEGAIRHALSRVAQLPPNSAIGLFDGAVGVAVAASRAGSLLNQPRFVESARELALRLADMPRAASVEDDLLSGRAGAIAGLLLLDRALTEPRLLVSATRIADELLLRLSTQLAVSQLLTGMAHGAGGIGMSLLALFQVGGDDAYRNAGEACFDHERRWFDDAAQNWADLRGVTNAMPGDLLPYATDWCHGAAGIALSRLVPGGDESFRQEARLGFETTRLRLSESLTAGFDPLALCLCHGPLACADVLLTAAQHLDDESFFNPARDAASVAATSLVVGQPDWRRAAWTPGLMSGMAGLGYFLLRSAGHPLPSVLLPLPSDFVTTTS